MYVPLVVVQLVIVALIALTTSTVELNDHVLIIDIVIWHIGLCLELCSRCYCEVEYE